MNQVLWLVEVLLSNTCEETAVDDISTLEPQAAAKQIWRQSETLTSEQSSILCEGAITYSSRLFKD